MEISFFFQLTKQQLLSESVTKLLRSRHKLALVRTKTHFETAQITRSKVLLSPWEVASPHYATLILEKRA